MDLPYYVATSLVIEKNSKLLLSLRQNTGWADDQMTLPGGHVEPGEAVKPAACREAKEELGLALKTADLTYLCTENRLTGRCYLSVVFTVKTTQTPVNNEPEKCKQLVWVDPHSLPANVAPNFKAIIEQAYLGSRQYLEFTAAPE